MSTSYRHSSALVALLALGYITSTLAAPAPQKRAAGVCGSFPYNVFLPLSAYAPAESYCSSHYPIATSIVTVTASASIALLTVTLSTDTTTSDPFTKTVTSTAPTITSTAPIVSLVTTITTTTTTTSTDVISAVAKRAPRTTASSSKTSSKATSTATSKTSSVTGMPAIFSSLESLGASIIKTACSCIETTPVVTKTITPTITSTSTVTAVSTVTVDYTTTNTQVTTPISTITSTTVSATTTTTTNIVVTTTSLACVPTSTQVVANPDFESGSAFAVTDWTLIGVDPFTSQICCYAESGSETILAAADKSGSCAVSQRVACVIVGSPYTISAYYGYVGGATPNAPVFSIVFEGVTVFTSNVCGPATTHYDGNSCNGDGNQHYFFTSVVVIPTTQNPTLNFQFDFLYSSGQAFNGLVDNTMMTLN